MKHHLSRLLFVYLLIISSFSSFIGDLSSSDLPISSSYEEISEGLVRNPGRSLLSFSPESKRGTALIAALDGKIHLLESKSMRVIWSFDSGPPIYTSYQATINQEDGKQNASGLRSQFFIDCGDDWELYMHSEHFGKMKLSMTIEDFVRSTPFVSEDGAVTLGSRKSTVFEIEPMNGKLIRSYSSSDSQSTSLSDVGKSVLYSDGSSDNVNDKDLLSSGLVIPDEPRLHITRTDYFLKSFIPGTEEVSWTMTVAELGATLLCPDSENPSKSTPFNTRNRLGSEFDFDFSMPLSCQSKGPIFRQRSNVLLESSGSVRQLEDHNMDNMLPLPASNPMLPSSPENSMLPAPTPNLMLPLEKNVSHQNNDSKAVFPLPSLSIDDSRIQEHETRSFYVNLLGVLFERPLAFTAIAFSLMLFGLVIFSHRMVVKQMFINVQPGLSDLKPTSSKKKKSRKLGRDNNKVEKKEALVQSENEDLLTQNKNHHRRWLYDNNLDGGANGRRIGKLFLSNKEIAKGSNGTVVFEGVYDGRPVAVKRLVQAHHDVAFKEIQNLIASDQHPNIVRWYGVEYDQDFVYLSLERCTCSLDDLIQVYSDLSQNTVINDNSDMINVTGYKLHLDFVKYVLPDLALWKANGLPSPLLLKLMRDVVFGLGHLHELGIIHRDLKPQNVLIIKERSLCAKLSDMGISKRLQGDMSSLGHHATGGCGSSGWQAPEQLLHGRQTRAVDLFSLGCVLFFCITGGRHPFGDRLERDVNIVKNQMDLFLVEHIPEAVDLISQLLNPTPELRPKAFEVLQHPLFWNSETRLSFFRDTSDRVELEDRETQSDLLKTLECITPIALGAKWDEKMEPAFMANIGRYRRYKYDSVRDLLRVMRNKLNHYRELPKEIQELVGPVPVGFDGYFSSRFPRLLMEVYKVMYRYCREEECFQKYFKSSVD